jgi:hypothetical protein
LDRRLGEPQKRSGRYGEKYILELTGNPTPNPPPFSPQPVAIPELSRLLISMNYSNIINIIGGVFEKFANLCFGLM